MTATRAQVYYAINGERDYQSKWDDYESQGFHEVAAYVLFMQNYLNQASDILTKSAEGCQEESLAAIRKVTALGVACMEEHGAPTR